MAPDIGEEDRHQIDRSVEPDAEDEAQHRPERKVAIGKQADVDEGLLGLRRAVGEDCSGDRVQDRSTTTTGEIQPRCGASLSAISRAARPVASRTSERQIEPFALPVRPLARQQREPASAAATPGTTLIRNSQCHE